MRINNNFNVLPFYDSLQKQNSKKWYSFGQHYPLICPNNTILPFQFITDSEVTVSSNIEAVNVHSGKVTNLGVKPSVSKGTQADATYYIVKMVETTISAMPEGLHYLRINTNKGYLYSEEFTYNVNHEECIKIEYWNENTLNFNSGEINFDDDFRFILYIPSTIGKPEYEFEEELTKRLGYKFIESQTSNKIYKFNFLAPEYICDAMRLIRLCDYIKLTTKFDTFNALSFAYEPKWQDNGDLAAVDVEFDTDCIIQKLESFNRRLKESFYNALLADIDEPVLFSNDIVAQYYTEFTTTSYINGKLIRQLEAINEAELGSLENLVLPIDNQSDTEQKAKKITLASLKNVLIKLADYVTLSSAQNINGEKNFIGGLKVNGSPIVYDAAKGYWKLQGNLVLTGGITMYADDGSVELPSLYDGLPIDGTTIYWETDEAGNRVLKAVGGGGTAESVAWSNITGKPSWIGSSKPTYTYSEIQNTPNLSLYATESWVNTKLGGYLPLSGGTITNTLQIGSNDNTSFLGLRIVRSGSALMLNPTSSNAYIGLGAFTNGTYSNKYMLLFGETGLKYSEDGQTTFKDILHSGNYSNYALPLSGGALSGSLFISRDASFGLYINNTAVSNSTGYSGMMFQYGGNNTVGLLGDSKGDLMIINPDYSNKRIIIHAGNIGSYNAGSATKLQTARTIWGQSFDGTGNVSGNLEMGISKVYWNNDASNYFITVNGAGKMYHTSYYGIFFRTGGSDRLAIDSTGNVGIGTTNPSSKLHVSGDITASGIISTVGLFANDGTIILKNSANGSGLLVYPGVDESTAARFEIRKNNALARTGFTLFTNGNFTIGTSNDQGCRFFVAGDAKVQGDILATGGITTNDSVTINGIKLIKSKDGVLYLDGNLVVKGGVTMYGTDATSSPSILDSLPIASTSSKGIAQFNPSDFAVKDGVVSFVGSVDGGVASSVAWGNITGKPTFATVATSGNYSDLSGLPTIPTIPSSLKNPYSLTFGSKTYDGSAARSIVASDLGALTAHQSIYALTIKNSGGTTQLTYTPNSAAGSLTLTKAMVGLGNVENTALSTWTGTNKITTLGTITSGTWNGSKIVNAYLANSFVTISGESVSLGGSITQSALRTALGLGSNAYTSTAYLPLSGGTLSGNLEMGISKVYWNNDASNYFITVNGAGKMYHTSYYGIFFRTGGSDRLAIDSTGNVGIGTTNPSSKLHVSGDVKVTGSSLLGSYVYINTNDVGIYFGPTSINMHNSSNNYSASLIGFSSSSITLYQNTTVQGNILATGGITMYSMRALKNVVDERGLSLNELSTIKPTRYTWKDCRDNRLHFGGIADDIQQVLPEVVYKTSDGILTMDYGNAAFAVASSLIKPVIDHEKRIAMLEEENKNLRQEVERLKSA